ncbi:uncharacterized protein [Paramormyrops kingsleyae]|uniref:uncharacterized protein n=1 Tax=Paramormyrops kingsleyae TaxID=1676925 RepID=UPI003B96B448
MPPHHLAYEALSALTGHDIKPVHEFHQKNPGKPAPVLLTHQEFMHHVLFASRSDHLDGSPNFFVGQRSIDNEYIRKELFVHEEEFFDPGYDYDFTHINDGTTQFKRGNELYKRPCGWNRIALKVLDKYKDGNGWLGTESDAWPVSYHGTSIEGAEGIIESYYKPGSGEVYGRGIYSAPKIETTFGYSKQFTSKSTKKNYKVVLQNRINPKERHITERADYWLVPVPKGTPPAAEKIIVESAIRPYGLLLKEVRD